MSITMSAAELASAADAFAPVESGFTELPFPPVTKQHILNCSYHNWHPKYIYPHIFDIYRVLTELDTVQ